MLQWGRRKSDGQPYIKKKRQFVSNILGSIKARTGFYTRPRPARYGFRGRFNLKIEVIELPKTDPDTIEFINAVREEFNQQPPKIRHQVKKIIITKGRETRLASMNDETMVLKFHKPDNLTPKEYKQIVRHEMDHFKLDYIIKHNKKEWESYREKISKLPPATEILSQLYEKMQKETDPKKLNELAFEYVHEYYAETGQYQSQKKHDLPHYHVTDMNAMEKASYYYLGLHIKTQ